MPLADFVPFVPEIFLAVAGFVLLLLAVPFGRRATQALSLAAVASLAVTAST